VGNYQNSLAALTNKVEGASEETLVERARLLPKVYLQLGKRSQALETFAEFHKEFPSHPAAPANLLAWAGALTQANRIEDAIERLRELADLYTDTREAWTARVWEAQLLLRLERWDEAKKMLNELIEDQDSPTEIRAEALFYLARVYEHEQDIDKAVEQLQKIEELGISGDSLRHSRIFRGKLLFMSGREEEGLQLLREVMQTAPQDPEVAEAQLNIANMLLDQDRPEDALREFQYYLEAFENPQGEARAFLGKGWCLYLLKDYSEAAEMFKQAMDLFPRGPLKEESVYKAGDSYFKAAMYEKAFDVYTVGLQLFPQSDKQAQMQFQAAECLNRLGREEEAKNMLAQLEKLFPASDYATRAAMKTASIEEKQKRWNDAIEEYTRIIEKYAGSDTAFQALHNRGMLFYRLSRFAHAIKDFEQLMEENEGSPLAQHAFFIRGWCFYLIGEEEKALEICNSFLEKYPRSQWAENVIFWIGNNYFNRGMFAEAEDRFAKMAATYPKGEMADSALFWAAQSAIKQKEYVRAVEYLGQLVKQFPESPKISEARFAQGDALSSLGKFSEAILVFEEIIKNHEQNSRNGYFVLQAWGRMGDCNFTLGSNNPKRYEQAMACYTHIVDSSEASPQIKLQAEFKIGRCLEKMEEADAALEHYMNVVYEHLGQRKKGNPGAPLWFTKAAFNAAQIAESREEWRKALNIYQRVLDADVASAPEAQKRIRKIRLDHWILF